ncbi:PucR family transcriptional regulator [Acetobacterium sp. K1/6]|uniref:PucR family transcriptional regulator n=1 Tax=Acetobacterium sp. K1/6 TaxID=3055467 RepID=UPI002ACAD2C1|nr:helix-turn-helix domain-containing protein [Acetobacterium sp. K1/6]MDZ5723690.1 helix-turn-helix domain-containing protein [Acetobacterium sp. K1/6]
MNLSLALLKEKLVTLVKDDNIGVSGSLLHLPHPVFYAGGDCLDSHILYITMAEKLPSNLTFMPASALICIGDPPPNCYNDALDLLVITDATDIFELSNAIHEIYEIYGNWDLKLQRCLREKKSLQHLADISELIFGNGMFVMNGDFYMVAHSKMHALYDSPNLHLDESGRIPIEQVNLFKNDAIYNKIKNEKNVFIYPSEVLPFRTLCQNIFLNDTFLFRIIVPETVQPFNDSDSQILEYLSQQLVQDPDYLATFQRSKNSQLETLLQNIMLGNAYNQTAFQKALQQMGWSQTNLYCVVHIKPSSQDIYHTTTTYFCNVIMQDFRQTFAFSHNQSILVIINLDHLDGSRDDYFKKFNRMVKDGNFKVGYSNYSVGLTHLKEYFREAEIALELGTRNDPTKANHKFCDAVLPYMLNQITAELPGQLLISPILMRLQDYDLKNHSDYVHTLRVFLNNNHNAVQTAKDLFIHRATIVYRLERIKEIGHTDLKNKDELLHLDLSFELIQLATN